MKIETPSEESERQIATIALSLSDRALIPYHEALNIVQFVLAELLIVTNSKKSIDYHSET